jgi:hypothetical protein
MLITIDNRLAADKGSLAQDGLLKVRLLVSVVEPTG